MYTLLSSLTDHISAKFTFKISSIECSIFMPLNNTNMDLIKKYLNSELHDPSFVIDDGTMSLTTYSEKTIISTLGEIILLIPIDTNELHQLLSNIYAEVTEYQGKYPIL